MPAEMYPHEENYLTDSSAITSQERLRQGVSALTANLEHILESGDVNTVDEYLGELLDDREHAFPVSERLAAFNFLSNEQKKNIRGSLLEVGVATIDNLEQNNSIRFQNIADIATQVQYAGIRAVDDHDQIVGNPVQRGYIDSNTLVQGQEAVSGELMSQGMLVERYGEALEEWAGAQEFESRGFVDRVNLGASRENSLDEAKKTLEPTYEGEHVNLSELIDNEVKLAAAKKIRVIFEEAKSSGRQPQQALAEVMTDDPDNASKQTVATLYGVACQIPVFIRGNITRVYSTAESSNIKMRNFMARGQEYYYASDPYAIRELFLSQHVLLRDIVNDTVLATQEGGNLLAGVSRDVAVMKDYLSNQSVI